MTQHVSWGTVQVFYIGPVDAEGEGSSEASQSHTDTLKNAHDAHPILPDMENGGQPVRSAILERTDMTASNCTSNREGPELRSELVDQEKGRYFEDRRKKDRVREVEACREMLEYGAPLRLSIA